MKLYFKLALGSFRKNGRFYLPYLLTCAGMVMMCYIVRYLAYLPGLKEERGGGAVWACLNLGTGIIGLFALIFLFYTNAFLMRRRKMEFGLYHILGLSKGNLGVLLLVETVLLAVLTLALGLAGGIALSKLSELLLFRLMGETADAALFVNLDALGSCLTLFGIIFLLLYLNGLRQLRGVSAIALLHSDRVGEKPPKANYVLALLGGVLLAGAYYVSVSIQNPIDALMVFFAAVAVVIVATYLLFIAGSVALCRVMQRNKGFYYRKEHFVSVSSMTYRMKRNGAGLASVCILSTMVLVMMVGCCCLYFGTESSLRSRYPQELTLRVTQVRDDPEQREGWEEEIQEILRREKVTAQRVSSYTTVSLAGILEGDRLVTDVKDDFMTLMGASLREVFLLPLADYNRMLGLQVTLEPGQALAYGAGAPYEQKTLTLGNACTLEITGSVGEMFPAGSTAAEIFPSLFLVVPELEPVLESLNAMPEYQSRAGLHPVWNYAFDAGLEPEAEAALADTLRSWIQEQEPAGYLAASRNAERADTLASFGSILFLGCLLTVVFLLATVLILYYKQVTEGYEDQRRFGIMRNVGMSKADIRKSVNSQLLLVFFLPLVTALLHLGFAFPIVRKLLMLFNLWDLRLLLGITGITVGVFVVFYYLVYRLTARTYYRIVAEG